MRKMGASMAEARGHEKTPQKRKDRLSFCPAQLEKRARAMTEPEERQSSDWSMLGLVRALCHGALYMLVRDIVPCMGN